MADHLNGKKKSDKCVNGNLEVVRRSARLKGRFGNVKEGINTVDFSSRASNEDSLSLSDDAVQPLKKRDAYEKENGLTSTPIKRTCIKVYDEGSSSLDDEDWSPNPTATNKHSLRNTKGKRCSKSVSPLKTEAHVNGNTTQNDCVSDDSDSEPVQFRRPNFKNNSFYSYSSLPCSPCKPANGTTTDQSCNGESHDHHVVSRMKNFSDYLAQPQVYNKENKSYLPFPQINKYVREYKCLDKNDPDLQVLREDHHTPGQGDVDSDSCSSTEEVLTPRDVYEKQSHDYDYQVMTFEEMYNSSESSIILRFRRERCYEGTDWLLHRLVGKDEPFAKILPKLAKKWKLNVTDIVLILYKPVILDDSPIVLNDTPRKRKILPTHFIDCLKLDYPVENLSFKGFVVLYMRNSLSCEKTVILHHEKKPMSIAMKEYSSVTGLGLKILEFWYKNIKINKKDTAVHLKMRKENDIVVYIMEAS